ncbi:MAG: Lrp/AsnC ligand binding domain-containing protein [Candidatus Bathyarchaeia archaeon]
MEAFMLLKAFGDHRRLMEDLSGMGNISQIYNIAGDNDVLIRIDVKSLEEFKNLINDIRSMEGVLNTTSYIVLHRVK